MKLPFDELPSNDISRGMKYFSEPNHISTKFIRFYLTCFPEIRIFSHDFVNNMEVSPYANNVRLTCINDRRGRDHRDDEEYAKHNTSVTTILWCCNVRRTYIGRIGSSDKNSLRRPRVLVADDGLGRLCCSGGDGGGGGGGGTRKDCRRVRYIRTRLLRHNTIIMVPAITLSKVA